MIPIVKPGCDLRAIASDRQLRMSWFDEKRARQRVRRNGNHGRPVRKNRNGPMRAGRGESGRLKKNLSRDAWPSEVIQPDKRRCGKNPGCIRESEARPVIRLDFGMGEKSANGGTFVTANYE